MNTHNPRNGTLSDVETIERRAFEVPYKLVGEQGHVVVNPHKQQALKVESLGGQYLGAAQPLDKLQNCHRKRQRPSQPSTTKKDHLQKTSMVETAYVVYEKKHTIQERVCPQDKKES